MEDQKSNLRCPRFSGPICLDVGPSAQGGETGKVTEVTVTVTDINTKVVPR